MSQRTEREAKCKISVGKVDLVINCQEQTADWQAELTATAHIIKTLPPSVHSHHQFLQPPPQLKTLFTTCTSITANTHTHFCVCCQCPAILSPTLGGILAVGQQNIDFPFLFHPPLFFNTGLRQWGTCVERGMQKQWFRCILDQRNYSKMISFGPQRDQERVCVCNGCMKG